MQWLLMIVLLVLLVFANGVFVAAEFALVRSNRDRLSSRLARRAHKNIERSLAGCQLGITLCSIAIGFVGEAMLAHQFAGLMGAALGLILSYLLVTGIHVVAGEQVPKLYAIEHPERTARWTAPTVLVLSWAFRPAVKLLDWMSRLGLKLMGVHQIDTEKAPTGEELDRLVARAAEAGHLGLDHAQMLEGVFDLHERTAKQVMTPAFDLAWVSPEAKLREALETSKESGHSRLLVGDGRTFSGLVHVAELASRALSQGAMAPIGSVVKPIPMVPETKPLDELLAELRSSSASLAVVADEYGDTVGVVAIEDIVEEIVGEITDETDASEVPELGEQLWDGSRILAGHLSLADLADEGIVDWTDDTNTTVAGWTFSRLGRRPEVGDKVSRDGWQVEVIAMDSARISQLKLSREDD